MWFCSCFVCPNRVAIAVGNLEAILVVNLHFFAYMGIANGRIINNGIGHMGGCKFVCVFCFHGVQVAVFKITTPNFGFSTGL